jgi:hypothetical protein
MMLQLLRVAWFPPIARTCLKGAILLVTPGVYSQHLVSYWPTWLCTYAADAACMLDGQPEKVQTRDECIKYLETNRAARRAGL